MKYHEKLRFLNKSYFNKIYIVLVLSFTYMAFDIFISVDTVNTVPVNKNQIVYIIYMHVHNQKLFKAAEISRN